ncbi:serine/arginine-rich splicing factor 4-like [Senna tora]|uniref:Serine/arginine-rich splicing factor 4-like n=1 Tax=Senna tora TaxID=362788 RepID=A0A834SVF6_9FABA|nr:serine/arginine-rich splicing factor 4-like [Senna tora]
MSLYIGNLSERTRRDELEHVFRRFGHCNVQLKREGYGFVVYDFPPDADTALRALQGRNICGEPLTLTWSNKQPKSFQRFAGGGRNYEMQRGRKPNLNEWRNYKIDTDVRNKSIGIPSEERGYRPDDLKDYAGEQTDYRGDFPDDGGGVLPNPEDNGRWGEPIHDPSIDNGNESAVDFDQYEPYHGYERKHENDNHQIDYSGSSPAENPPKNLGRVKIGDKTSNHPNDPAYRLTCYRCGDSGHKMRNCPKENSFQRKYKRLDDGQDGKINRKHRAAVELNKFGSGSSVKLQSSGDTSLMRHQRNERGKETEQAQRNNYEGKKRSKREIESPKKSSVKKARRSVTSSLPSDHTASHVHSISQSSKSMQKPHSHSRSRSVSSSARSSSPNLRSLSVSLGQSLLSSPNKVHLNSKGSTFNAIAPESLDHLVAGGQQIDRNLELDKDKSKDTIIAVNGNAALYTNLVDGVGKDQYVQDNNENDVLFSTSDKLANLTKSLPNSRALAAGNLSSEMMKETENVRHSGSLVMDNIPPVHLATMSSEEMCMVFKHYGLELPKDDEQNLTVDAFFGSARLWPWHIIYYRRLKKGPISTENYARRVAQNQEFGIVDKYIRSSSGWGEMNRGSS